MLVYERILKRGRTIKRKDAFSSRGSRPPQKRRRTETLVSAVTSPPVGTTLTAWPARSLKRYPSWVDHLHLGRFRQARFVEEAVRFARLYYDAVVFSGGGSPLCYIPDECQSVGASLGDVCIEEIKKDLPSDHEQFVFAVSCVVNAFDQLRRVSEND